MRLLAAIMVAVSMDVAFAAGPAQWVPPLLSAEEAAEGFFPLFNGETLDGWTIRGDNHRAYAAQGGHLLITGQGNGGWMFTDRPYANFVLRLEYKLHPEGGNSGVAVRATPTGNPSFSGMEIQVVAPAPPSVSSAGALLAAVAPQVQADKPAGEWNAMEIVCDGPRVQTTLNGQVLYDINIDTYDSPDKENTPLPERAREGFIAIQDHADHVEFRNIRIKPLPGGPDWQPLFNGNDLAGWNIIGEPVWHVTPEGLLRAETTAGVHSLLRTDGAYGNFELKLSARTGDNANSGVFFRSRGDEPSPAVYEAQINNHDAVFFTGAIFDQAPATELRAADHHWFHMHVIANGPEISVAVNGAQVVEYTSPKHEGHETGWIALQARDPASSIEFKNVEIRPLPE
jgi:hypothetical protein